jgi:hypothetical protein
MRPLLFAAALAGGAVLFSNCGQDSTGVGRVKENQIPLRDIGLETPRGNPQEIARLVVADFDAERLKFRPADFDPASKESTDKLVEEIWPEWSKSLETATKTRLDFNHVQSLRQTLPRMNELFPNGRFSPEQQDKYVKRIQSIRPETVFQWSSALGTATGISIYQIDKINSVLRMIRRERLWEGTRLEPARYESELRRLRSLNRDTVLQFGRSKMGPAVSASIEESVKKNMFSGYDDLVMDDALQLVEVDPLFVEDRLQTDLLRSSLPEIESAFDAIRARVKRPSAPKSTVRPTPR